MRNVLHRTCAVAIAWVAFVALLPDAHAAPLVVLDPGHGGDHRGAVTAHGAFEKDVVLSVALHARRELEKRGVRVLMTRDADRTIELSDRIRIANEAGASVFVSIHANSSPLRPRRGVETYVLSPRSSDDTAHALALLENDDGSRDRPEMGDVTGGGVSMRPASDLDLILDDLTLSVAHEGSAGLAKSIQDRLGRHPGLGPNRGLRQAPFRVLRGARCRARRRIGRTGKVRFSNLPPVSALRVSAFRRACSHSWSATVAAARDDRSRATNTVGESSDCLLGRNP